MKAETEITVARALIHRHGLRAAAVAQEHVAEALAQGDREAASRWSNVRRAVSELQAEARVA
jgi:triphosphoribosyl-dephospho-CoA synthetase